MASAALNKPTLSSLVVLGDISISGSIIKVEELANVFQICLDSGTKSCCCHYLRRGFRNCAFGFGWRVQFDVLHHAAGGDV